MSDKFDLKSPFEPAGDQPDAIKKLTSLVKSGNKNQVLLGVTGSGKTLTMAHVIANLNRPTLVIAHNKTLAAQLATEFHEFFPNNAVQYFVSYYDYYQPEAYIPRTDTFIEKETMINDEIDRLRNSATQSLLTRRDVIIVASVSCIYGLGNPSDYLDLALTLKVKTSIKRDKILRRLVDLQYQRNNINASRGTFQVKGDTFEIIPASEELIYRISFWGDEIEKIQTIETITGKTLETLNEITIFPAKHFVANEEKMEHAVVEIEKELTERVKELKAKNKLLEAQRIEQRTKFDIEMMKEMGYVSGIENYSKIIEGRESGSPPSTLLDYYPDDMLLFIDESHITIPQIRGMYFGDRSRKETLVEYGFRLPSAMDNRPLKFHEFSSKTEQTVFVSATPGPYELDLVYKQDTNLNSDIKEMKLAEIVKSTKSIVEQVIRPTGLIDPVVEIKPIKGQVDDAVTQINKRILKGERALVTTLTKKMAEELSDYMSDLRIKVHYLHSEIDTFERLEILRDLRLGVYDVVVGINLLREGLDLPEVSLILILDADKEGFLRSETSLIQTIGRAARHINGTVIMYADKMTGSMQRAIDETNRRRKIQTSYNKKHNITPKGIQKKITETRLAGAKMIEEELSNQIHQKNVNKMNRDQVYEYLIELREQMDIASSNLEFEKAVKLRDLINDIEKKKGLRKN